jgi:hypothetical protein
MTITQKISEQHNELRRREAWVRFAAAYLSNQTYPDEYQSAESADRMLAQYDKRFPVLEIPDADENRVHLPPPNQGEMVMKGG